MQQPQRRPPIRAVSFEDAGEAIARLIVLAGSDTGQASRVAAGWLPEPMRIGAFDHPESDDADAFDGEPGGGEGEDMEAHEMA